MTTRDITRLFDRVRNGRDEEAVAGLWQAYYGRLVEVARRNLGDLPKRVADEEDVAASAMRSFVRAAEAGRLNELQNRTDLWKLLLTITIRKTNRHKKEMTALKRGGAQGATHDLLLLDTIVDQKLVSELMLECQDLIEALPNATLKQIALQRLEGHSVEEISKLRHVAQSTIKRKLARIREIWAAEFDDT